MSSNGFSSFFFFSKVIRSSGPLIYPPTMCSHEKQTQLKLTDKSFPTNEGGVQSPYPYFTPGLP